MYCSTPSLSLELYAAFPPAVVELWILLLPCRRLAVLRASTHLWLSSLGCTCLVQPISFASRPLLQTTRGKQSVIPYIMAGDGECSSMLHVLACDAEYKSVWTFSCFLQLGSRISRW